MEPAVAPDQKRLLDTWDAHTRAEFELKDADAAIATMTDDPALVHVAVGTGATGKEALRRFYAEVFIPQIPADWGLDLLTRSITAERIVEEFILRFTHTVKIDWMIPGLAPTGRPVAVPTVAVVAFEGDKIASEHIYWDQATVLAQLGAIDDRTVPVMGAEASDRLLDVEAPANELIARFS